jgi:hypothetical protein
MVFNADTDVKKLTKQPDADSGAGFFGAPSNDPGF